MKTKAEMQAIVNEIREVCKLHGVVLLPGPDEIVICEAEQVNLVPSIVHKSVDDDEIMLTNQVIENPQRGSSDGHDVDHFSIWGIGDVAGITKPRIVVSEYHEGDTDLFKGAQNAVDVNDLTEVDNILFVKNARFGLGFTHFSIELSHGPFGVLVAHYQDSKPVTVGFIEGAPEEDLLKQWPPQESTHGGV